jgi:hypothetical protein
MYLDPACHIDVSKPPLSALPAVLGTSSAAMKTRRVDGS